MEKSDIVKLEIDLIEENPWNPNIMSDVKFNKLVDEIEENGFMDPIQVVPLDDGMYRIIGGAHRYNAALILGYEKVPAIILRGETYQDEEFQKLLTLRLNLIKGKMTPSKFVALYEDLSKRHGEEEIREAMALIDKNEWEQVKKELLGNIKAAVGEGEMMEGFDEVVKELKTIDDVTKLLEIVFGKNKEKGKKGYVFSVGTGGGKVLTFDINEKNWDKLMKVKEYLIKNDKKFQEIIENSIIL